MIEFMKDGPCDDDSGEHDPAARSLVIGLGQAGINVLDQLVIHGREAFDVLALDTDQTAVEGSVAPAKELLGLPVVRGLGCFGDVERAKAVWDLESPALLRRLESARDVVIAVGLGGGTGSHLAIEIVRSIRRREGRVVVVCALPFSFEAESRQSIAKRTLVALRSEADAVLALDNDRVDRWNEADANVRHGLHGLNLELAQAVETVVQVLAPGGMNPITFADLRSLFGRFGGLEVGENCWVGRATVHTGEGVDVLVARALESPLLADPETWRQADSCVACVVGGTDLPLGQLKALAKTLQASLPGQLPVLLGSRIVEGHEGRIKLALLLAVTRAPEATEAMREMAPAAEPVVDFAVEPEAAAEIPTAPVEPVAEFAVEPEPEAAPTPRRGRRAEPVKEVPLALGEEFALSSRETKPVRRTKPVKQEELPFEAGSRGRFENSLETIYKGENLDQPTFRRRRIVIKA